MLALSTAWLSATLDDGMAILERIKKLEEFSAIELDYRLNAAMLASMLLVVRAGEFQVASIHAPCPVPQEVNRLAVDEELQLSNLDREARAHAIAAAERSINLAADLETPVVILHLGRVEVPGELTELRVLFDKDRIDTEEAAEVRGELLVRRRKVVRPYHDAVFFSLDQLLECARQRSILLALENRPAFYDIPNAAELVYLFREFEGSQLRFCYDAGNAAVQENLGWTTQRALLEAHRQLLCGVHLHDANGYRANLIDERRQTDYRLIQEFITPETPCIIEVDEVEEELLLDYVEVLKDEGFTLRSR